MAMSENFTFVRDDVLPSWWANRIQNFISGLALNLALVQLDATHVQVGGGTAEDAPIISIDGMWRWHDNASPVIRAHPGGTAGPYDIFVTTAANRIVSSPNPGTDTTVYDFDLAIVASGDTPTIVSGTVDHFRRIGFCAWNGTAITSTIQTVGVPPAANALTAAQRAAVDAASGASGANPFLTPTDPHMPQIGFMMDYAGSGDPNANWLLCDGRALSRTTYATLFGRLGTTYGAGDGSSTFNIPDARSSVMAAPDNMGTARGAAGRLTTLAALGNRSGAQNHAHACSGVDHLHASGGLTVPDHIHGIALGVAVGTANRGTPNGYSGGAGESVAFTNHVHSASVNGATGGSSNGNSGLSGATAAADRSLAFTSGATDSRQPTLIVNKVIRVL